MPYLVQSIKGSCQPTVEGRKGTTPTHTKLMSKSEIFLLSISVCDTDCASHCHLKSCHIWGVFLEIPNASTPRLLSILPNSKANSLL